MSVISFKIKNLKLRTYIISKSILLEEIEQRKLHISSLFYLTDFRYKFTSLAYTQNAPKYYFKKSCTFCDGLIIPIYQEMHHIQILSTNYKSLWNRYIVLYDSSLINSSYFLRGERYFFQSHKLIVLLKLCALYNFSCLVFCSFLRLTTTSYAANKLKLKRS